MERQGRQDNQEIRFCTPFVKWALKGAKHQQKEYTVFSV